MQNNGSMEEGRLDALKDSVRNLVESERAERLKSRAIHVKDAVIDNGGAALRRTGSAIKDHPILAIAIAFGVGFVTLRLLKK